MSYFSKVGSFNLDSSKTVGQTQAVSGIGFQPKIVIFFWSGSTATGDNISGGTYCVGLGAGISSSSRFCTYAISEDAVADSDTRRGQYNLYCIMFYTDTDTLDGACDFYSMDSDGFTLIYDDPVTANWRISYIALGGSDITDVYIGNKQMPTTPGEYTISGVGFQPDAIIFAGVLQTAINSGGSNGGLSLGLVDGTTQTALNFYAVDAQATSTTRRYGKSGICLYRYGSYYESWVSMNSDGFVNNHLSGTSGNYYFFICLKGARFHVGEITTSVTGSATVVENTIGWQPSTLLFMSVNQPESSDYTMTNHASISIGAATSSSERACVAIWDETGLADTETAYANYDSAVYANVADDTIGGLMDLQSIDSGGFTCVMDDGDLSACWVMYLALGPSTIPTWVSPLDGVSMNTTPVLVFTMPTFTGNAHFDMELDTANTFDTGNLREIKTNNSQVGWEYWDGDSWEPFPSSGVADTYAGNNCRYTVQTPLSETTWYRRVRMG